MYSRTFGSPIVGVEREIRGRRRRALAVRHDHRHAERVDAVGEIEQRVVARVGTRIRERAEDARVHLPRAPGVASQLEHDAAREQDVRAEQEREKYPEDDDRRASAHRLCEAVAAEIRAERVRVS